jgi:hypothetical protein
MDNSTKPHAARSTDSMSVDHCAFMFSGTSPDGTSWTARCGAVRDRHPHRGLDGSSHEFVLDHAADPLEALIKRWRTGRSRAVGIGTEQAVLDCADELESALAARHAALAESRNADRQKLAEIAHHIRWSGTANAHQEPFERDYDFAESVLSAGFRRGT